MSKKLCPSPQRAADLLHGGGFGATPTHSRKQPAFAPPPAFVHVPLYHAVYHGPWQR